MPKLGIVSGGSGSSKFVLGFSRYLESVNDNQELGIVSNVADNFWHKGLYICPDVDIITYALAGKLDESKGWGLESDSFNSRDAYSELSLTGGWFNLGDKDLALCVRRTELLNRGWKLSTITANFTSAYRIKHMIVPATDDPVETFVKTTSGWMHLQELWVKNKGESEVKGIEYVGIESANPNSLAKEVLKSKVVICPANPITSILPTIRLKGIEKILSKSSVTAISPFVGTAPFSGPAARLMASLGIECTSYGVAKLYSKFLKLFFVDLKEDRSIIKKISDEGIECVKTNTRIDSREDQLKIAKEVLTAI